MLCHNNVENFVKDFRHLIMFNEAEQPLTLGALLA
jgi:hypothetical protein